MVSKATVRHLDMNRLEAAYAEVLEQRRLAGEIQRWDYEPERLILAKRTSYLPDFRVVLANGELEFHETKGFVRDDAIVKLKVAARLHPYRFYLVRKLPKRDGGGWDIREIQP